VCAVRTIAASKGGVLKRLEKNRTDNIELTVKKYGPKFVVHNPPDPHIGVRAIVDDYSITLSRLEKKVVNNPNSSKEQLDYYARIKLEYDEIGQISKR